jgi:CO dehydrogenase maturation factor
VDLLCIVSEPTAVGALTARRIFDLAGQLPIVVKKTGVVWNKANGDRPSLDGLGEVLAQVPEDAALLDASRRGDDIFTVAPETPAYQAVRALVARLLEGGFAPSADSPPPSALRNPKSARS